MWSCLCDRLDSKFEYRQPVTSDTKIHEGPPSKELEKTSKETTLHYQRLYVRRPLLFKVTGNGRFDNVFNSRQSKLGPGTLGGRNSDLLMSSLLLTYFLRSVGPGGRLS